MLVSNIVIYYIFSILNIFKSYVTPIIIKFKTFILKKYKNLINY